MLRISRSDVCRDGQEREEQNQPSGKGSGETQGVAGQQGGIIVEGLAIRSKRRENTYPRDIEQRKQKMIESHNFITLVSYIVLIEVLFPPAKPPAHIAYSSSSSPSPSLSFFHCSTHLSQRSKFASTSPVLSLLNSITISSL